MSPECERLVGRKRIRKDVNRLTPEEKSHLNRALTLAMTNTNNDFLFKDIANYHGAPYLCGGACCPHNVNNPEFLPWHRLYTGTSVHAIITCYTAIPYRDITG